MLADKAIEVDAVDRWTAERAIFSFAARNSQLPLYLVNLFMRVAVPLKLVYREGSWVTGRALTKSTSPMWSVESFVFEHTGTPVHMG